MLEDVGELRTRAVDYLSKIKGISDVNPTGDTDLANGGAVVTARLKENGEDSWGWYYEKGDVKRALFTGEEIAQFIAKTTAGRSFLYNLSAAPPLDVIKICVVSVLTLAFAVAVIAIVARDPDNKSLQVLTGLLGLTLGYFVGKSDKTA